MREGATTLAPAVHPHRHIHRISATHRDVDKESKRLSIFSSPDNPPATAQEAAWHASTLIPPHSFSRCTAPTAQQHTCIRTYQPKLSLSSNTRGSYISLPGPMHLSTGTMQLYFCNPSFHFPFISDCDHPAFVSPAQARSYISYLASFSYR